MKNTLICPNCRHEIDIEKALFDQIASRQNAEIQRKRKELEALISEQESVLQEREAELKNKIATQEEVLNSKLKEREAQMKEKLRLEISDCLRMEVEENRLKMEEQKSELNALKKRELGLLREKEKLEQERQDMELTLQRKLTEEKTALEERVRKQEQESNFLRNQEKDELINNLNLQMSDMKRKLEQGSMQSQGEILELELERMLTAQFPFDDIREVPKGVNGADLVQEVKNIRQQKCGSILYETKRTKNFSPTWIDKLKSDQRTVAAEIAVLVTEVLPKGMTHFGLMNGVWICTFQQVNSLVLALREGLLQIQDVRASGENKSGKMAQLYEYLTNQEFAGQIQAIVDGFVGQKDLLEREKRSMQAVWKQREKQIEMCTQSAISLYSTIKAIAGHNSISISSLELPINQLT
ncbi:MAG TPA: DUF2130 domain-containing protein [Bacteroidia bacterium]|nr:DUF2130 domain-containing protein [Bacteroidia bacterium]